MRTLKLLFVSLLLSNSAFAQIEGEVVDENNKALAKVMVIVIDSIGKRLDTAKTDNRGLYIFNFLKPGKYTIEARASGFVTAVFKNIEVEKETNLSKSAEILKDFIAATEFDDTYYAIRLDIILKPVKIQK